MASIQNRIMEMCITGYSAMDNTIHSIWKSKGSFSTSCKQCCPQLHKTASYTTFPQCLRRLRNPSHSFCLSIQSEIFCWLRKALHIYHIQSHSNLFCPLHRAFSFCKIHFTDLYPPFLQSRLFSR